MEIKNLARPGVYERQASFSCSRGNTGKISAFEIKLPQQTVQIFIDALLSGTIRVGKIYLTMQSFFNAAAKQALLLPWPLTTVSASQFPASWQLYTDLSLLRINFPLLYFPLVSFLPWLFPLRRSTFKLPFTKYFS